MSGDRWSDAHLASLAGDGPDPIASLAAANLSMMVEVPSGLRDLPPVVTLREYLSVLTQAVGTPLSDALSMANVPEQIDHFQETAVDAMDDLLDAFDAELRKRISGTG